MITNTQKAEAAKQIGIAKASKGKDATIAVARRKARELAQHGPISVDDVTEALIASDLDTTLPTKNNKPRKWKGSIFRTGEWLCIGETQSRYVSNHSRPVKMWVLKSWLQSNSLNGTEWPISSFRLLKIYGDFQRAHPEVELERCNWIIGTSELSEESRYNIKNGGNMLYGIPVTFVAGAVGAMLQPPRQPIDK